ncbi:MAG: hypothetical protein JO235_23855 [Chroococcidiopsidaceae cyanobacterium CP_BM_RX_35]|nr:hypothetical protein [Chroococcidiopsidaceae cyanobacterium CP_BM_RX_35]
MSGIYLESAARLYIAVTYFIQPIWAGQAQAEALKTIERNTKLQTQLIKDLLDISRIMQGKLSLTATPMSLTFVISAAAAELNQQKALQAGFQKHLAKPVEPEVLVRKIANRLKHN